MMAPGQKKVDLFVLVAIVLTTANVCMVWTFRFLPLYDYPIWLYEIRIMREMSDPLFSSVYEMISAPVPNLGFVGPVWLLSFLLPLEAAGKIFLSLCVIGLPWSFWFCVRQLSNNSSTPIAYAGFPFAYNIYFYGGQAFLFGLIILLFMIGYFFPKSKLLSMRDWMLLSLLFLLMYFVHALAFVLAVMVFFGALLVTKEKKKTLFALVASLIPALVCLLWYFVLFPSEAPSDLQWSVWGLVQNIFKSLFLFIKSYGIPTPIPLTLMNLAWLAILGYFVASEFTTSRKSGLLDRRFLIPIVLSLVLMLALPEIFLGVYRPGTRFGLPLVFLILLSFGQVQPARSWSLVFLIVATTVVAYNVFHFNRVNQEMGILHADLQNTITSDAPFCMVRFDWPPERRAWDVAAASVDPLFGGVYYTELQRHGVGWIFGTALLRLRNEHRNLKPELKGQTPEEQAAAFMHSRETPSAFKYIVLIGNNKGLQTVVNVLTKTGYQLSKAREHWTILESQLYWK